MRIWKWLGWDTKEARTDRVKNINWHSTIQWGMLCLAIIVVAVSCQRMM